MTPKLSPAGNDVAEDRNELSWSQLHAFRRAAAQRLGDIYSLPIAKRASDLLVQHANSGNRILEIGAGDRRMRAKLTRECGPVDYESVDPDPAGNHDYRELSEVDGSYDLVVSFETAEHIPLAELRPWLRMLLARTRPGGTLILSTPNTYYPPAYLRDATHCTPLCYDELAGLCAAAGWHVTAVHRVHHEPLHRTIVRRYLFGWLFRLLGLDFAKQIVLVARRTA